MSAKVMGHVWDLDLPMQEKYVLLAMADHAHHDGSNVFPALDLIAFKTGYSKRTVQRYIRKLEDRGILVRVREPINHPIVYRVDLQAGDIRQYKRKQDTHDKAVSPLRDATTDTGVTELCHPSHDTAVSPPHDKAVSPKPSITVKEPSLSDVPSKIVQMPVMETSSPKKSETDNTRQTDMAKVFKHYDSVFGGTMSKSLADDIKDWCDEYGADVVIASMSITKKQTGRYVSRYMAKVLETQAQEHIEQQAEIDAEAQAQAVRDKRAAQQAAMAQLIMGDIA
jgi:DNA-binding Lrp family transcriptional regulator